MGLEESPEIMIREHVRQLGAEDLPDLIQDVTKYQVFHDEAATVVAAPRGSLGGVVVWNLLPGQENDYHMHPESEHFTYVVEGELEFTIADQPARVMRPGEYVVIPAGIAHGIRNISGQRGTYVALTTPGNYQKVLVERP